MKFIINKSYVYLYLVYLTLGLLTRYIFREQFLTGSIWQPIIFIVLLFIVIISYEPLLRVIEQFTSVKKKTKTDLFNKVLEINKKIQNHLEINVVLKLIETELIDLLEADKIIIFVNKSIAGKKNKLEVKKRNSMLLWHENENENENENEINDDVVSEIISLNKIFTINENTHIKDIFIKSNTNLAIPVIHNRQLLCLILISQYREVVTLTVNQIEILEYFSNQLALFLDRIRIYQKVMLQTVMDHAEKMQVMESISSNIAHEMRTPLSGIRASISGVEDYLPELIKAYQHSYLKNPEEFPAIREDHLNGLISTPNRITLMIDQANTVIDMLLMNLREKSLDDNQMNICSAKKCIEQAVERYPFRSGERDKVKLDLSEDFDFLGIESLFIYLIFNLLKNSLYSISSAQKGNIVISLEAGLKLDTHPQNEIFNLICFRDSGEGADQGVINKMFDSFFTTKEGGTGAGLAYCKRTIENFNGKIACESIAGEYCEFKMWLPELKIFS